MILITNDSKLTVKAFYTSRYTKMKVTLVNPSNEHLQRLYTKGHDILIHVIDEKFGLVKITELKY